MRRTLLLILLFLVGLLVLAGFILFGSHGQATLEWLGWRVDTTASAIVGGALIAGLLVALLIAGLAWLARTPARFAAAKRATRARGRRTALRKGFVALAAGDAAEARRQARRARELTVQDPPDPLPLLLDAQAAEAEGDDDAAALAYESLLPGTETALAGRRGLMRIALRLNDQEAAVRHAEAAYELSGEADWAWRVLFEARLRSQDWPGALALVETAERRRTLPAGGAAKVRAALAEARDGTAADAERLDRAMAAVPGPPPPEPDDPPLTLR